MGGKAPWTDVTVGGVYWNCADRLEKLLAYLRPWFTNVVVAVQESPDRTAEVAAAYADRVIADRHWGYGDASMGRLLAEIKTRWVFIVSDDEWPTEELLASFGDLVDAIMAAGAQGAWIHFHSTIDGFDFTSEQHEHLRVFEPGLGWPKSLHARPMQGHTIVWRPNDAAHIRHDRSLDEMVRDYLRYEEIAERENASPQIREHNQRMIRDAVNAIAERKGWRYVRRFPWYRTVKPLLDGA